MKISIPNTALIHVYIILFIFVSHSFVNDFLMFDARRRCYEYVETFKLAYPVAWRLILFETRNGYGCRHWAEDIARDISNLTGAPENQVFYCIWCLGFLEYKIVDTPLGTDYGWLHDLVIYSFELYLVALLIWLWKYAIENMFSKVENKNN